MSTPSQMQKLGKKLLFAVIIFLTLIPIRTAVLLVSVIQFAYTAYSGRPHHYLLTISSFLSQYITSCLNYVLFLSDVLPYPFNRFS